MSNKISEVTVDTLYPLLVQYGFPVGDFKQDQLGKVLFERNHARLNLLKYGLSELDEDIEKFFNRCTNLEKGITRILQEMNFLPEGCKDKFIMGDSSIKEQVIVWKKLLDTLELLSSAADSTSKLDTSIFTEALNELTDKNSERYVEELAETVRSELSDNMDDGINDSLPPDCIIQKEADLANNCNHCVSDIQEVINNFSSKFGSEINLPQDVQKPKIHNREELRSVLHNFHESVSSVEKLLMDLRNCMK